MIWFFRILEVAMLSACLCTGFSDLHGTSVITFLAWAVVRIIDAGLVQGKIELLRQGNAILAAQLVDHLKSTADGPLLPVSGDVTLTAVYEANSAVEEPRLNRFSGIVEAKDSILERARAACQDGHTLTGLLNDNLQQVWSSTRGGWLT